MRTSTPYSTGAVTSADGTTISYRRLGDGPGLLLLSGGYLAAQHYMELAGALAAAFTVVVPDRRGRGLSGPPGARYSLARECEDVEALLTGTGAHLVFGHSSGGLIALEAARGLPAIRKVAVFEPALSMYGAFRLDWIPRFERELDQGRLAAAMVTFSKGVQANQRVDQVPRWLLVPLIGWYLKAASRKTRPGEQPLDALIPLQRYDVRLFKEASTGKGYAGLEADALLMEGDRTPPPVHAALDALQADLPRARRVTLDGVGHEAPIDSRGAPERVAKELRDFFTEAT